MAASHRVSTDLHLRGQTLSTLIGLLASTGLRSGEALRLDRSDVDLATGVRRSARANSGKTGWSPFTRSTLAALREYTRHRDLAFPASADPAFFSSAPAAADSAAAACLRLSPSVR